MSVQKLKSQRGQEPVECVNVCDRDQKFSIDGHDYTVAPGERCEVRDVYTQPIAGASPSKPRPSILESLAPGMRRFDGDLTPTAWDEAKSAWIKKPVAPQGKRA